MKNTVLIGVAAIASAAFCADEKCAFSASHDETHHAHERGSGESAYKTGTAFSSVRLAQKDAINAGIRTALAERRSADDSFSFYGRFELTPSSSSIVPSIAEGILDLKVASLQDVKKGDVLFTVFSPEVLSRRNELEILSKRLSVYKNANTPNAELENVFRVKKTELESLLCGLQEEGGTVKFVSPADGIADGILKLNGSWVNVGDSVVRVTDMRLMRFKALLPVEQASRLRDGLQAEVGGNKGIVKLAPGGDTGLVPVYVVFRNKIDAMAGQRAVAQVSLREKALAHKGHDEMILVPRSSIVDIGLKKHIFIQDKNQPDKYVAWPVSVLKTIGKNVAIAEIPHEGCRIVVEGAYELKIALSDGKNPAGHFHADGTFHEGENH